jgi:hypothetical protein
MTDSEFKDFIMNEVSDEKIEKFFADMGIKINLKKNQKNLDSSTKLV